MMFTTATRQRRFNPFAMADAERYRRYANAKSRIPRNLSATEYEARVQALARKYKI